MAAVAAEALVVGADQVRLADGGRRLELRQVIGPTPPAELAHPRADGTRADQGHLCRPVDHSADLLGQVADPVRVERAVGAGQDARADLDDPGAGREHHIVADQVARGIRPGPRQPGRRKWSSCSRSRPSAKASIGLASTRVPRRSHRGLIVKIVGSALPTL